MSNPNSPDPQRPIRSYVIRSGRQTDAQRYALDNYWRDHVIPYKAAPLPIDEVFTSADRLVVEIGFGMGDSLLQMAQQNPQSLFVGIDVHRPGVGKLLHGIVENKLTNLKIVCHDAKEVLAHCFTAESIDRVLILFPDPWPKKRHHKRRLIQTEFVELIMTKLKPGGEIHLATDWEAYAEQMLVVMQSITGLHNAMGPNEYWSQPQRPETKFERRGKKLGHGVWDLLFSKQH